jgi:hypothetical protein
MKQKFDYTEARGEGYGGRPREIGSVFQVDIENDGAKRWVRVETASEQFYREDGLSFGVGDDSGYIFIHGCSFLSDAEAAKADEALNNHLAKVEAWKQREQSLTALVDDFIEHGARPANFVAPKTLTEIPYGQKSWLGYSDEVTAYYCQYNGLDGDNWAESNYYGSILYVMENRPDIVRKIKDLSEHIAAGFKQSRLDEMRYSLQGAYGDE